MQLSPQHVAVFQSIYKERFAITLSVQEAHAKILQIVRLVQLLYEPMTKQEFQITTQELQKLRDRLKAKTEYTRDIHPIS